jgi:hypothetical protein
MTESRSELPPRPTKWGAESAAWGFGLFAACRALSIGLDALPLAASMAQAVLVDWGASRAGLASTRPDVRTAIARAAKGTAAGFGVSAMLASTLWLTHSLRVERVDHLEVSVLGIGLLTAALRAWRDEIILHGITLRALESTSLSALSRVLACGITSAGAALGDSGATASTVASSMLLGVIFGALWHPGSPSSGALVPWAAHTALRWSLDTLLLGGLAHARLGESAWAGGSSGFLAGAAASVAIAPLTFAAVAWTLATMSPPRPRLG